MRQDPTRNAYPNLPRTSNKQLLIKAGKKTISIQFSEIGDESGKHAKLNKKTATSLCLPVGSYAIYDVSDGILKLGPIIGIITNRDSQKNYPSGKNARLFREIFEACRQRGMFIFEFTPNGVDFRTNTIKGCSLNEKGRFYNGIFPMPDIVYNRIRFRVVEQALDVQKILMRFRNDPDIYLFNTRFLNKLEVYKILREDSAACNWVPETALLNSKNLRMLLSKYNSVYVKPIANSRGKGILRISKGQNNEYALHYAHSKYSQRKKNISNVYINLKLAGLKSNNYLVQKAISLATFQGRLFDLRVQSQKNGSGKWFFTGVGVRVAGPNRIVTHIPNGGTAKEYDFVMREVFGNAPETRENIDHQLRQIALTVPEILEKKLKIDLAIVSMDIGIDKKGKLWLIEVNSKPASFDEDQIRAMHTKNLAEYFLFAALNKSSKGMVKHWN